MCQMKVESLKHLSILNIATSLWTPDLLKKFERDISVIINVNVEIRYSNYCGGEWDKITKKVEEKTLELPVSDNLQKDVARYVETVGEQLLAWIYQNYKEFKCKKMLPGKIFWTGHGTINKEEMARDAMTDETLTLFGKFNLACFYCLEDFIRSFWGRLTESELKSVKKQPPGFLLWLWPTDLDSSDFKKKVDKNISLFKYFPCNKSVSKNAASYLNAFQLAIGSGNELAARYFFKKLNEAEKDQFLVKIMRNLMKSLYYPNRMHGVLYREVFHFLTINLDLNQQITLTTNHSEFRMEILACFIERLRLWSFMYIFKLVSEYLDANDIHVLIGRILFKVNDYDRDYDYLEVYKNVWESSSLCEGSIIDHLNSKLSVMLGVGKQKNVIRYVLEFADSEGRKKIFLKSKKVIEAELIRQERWDDLKFFLKSCDLPLEMLKGLKRSYVRSPQGDRKLIQVLDELIAAA